MNREFMEFIQKNNIKIEEIYDDLQIYSEQEINSIIANYKLEGNTIETIVSIADIIGYDYGWGERSNNLAKNFSCFFSNTDSYHSRSLGMLKYTSDDIVDKLQYSFTREPIKVLELDNGKKVISVNGLHRYTLLRIHYLNELHIVKGDQEKEKQIRKKYGIPVQLTQVDLLKTYCHFLIKYACPNKICVSTNYDENYNRTGKVEVSTKKERLVLNDAELLKYTKNIIRNIPESMIEFFISNINMYCEFYDSFKVFIDTYFSEEISLLSEKNNKKGRGFNNDIL